MSYQGALLFGLAIIAIAILNLIAAIKFSNYLQRKLEEDKKNDPEGDNSHLNNQHFDPH